MSASYQESEIEFVRLEADADCTYPEVRSVVIRCYGGTAEECIKKVRAELHLGSEWVVVSFKEASI